MKQKSPKWIEDIRVSSAFILQASAGKTFQDYQSDPLLRPAVERHFEIIGEAMNRLVRYDPDTAVRIGDYPRIIAFRNLLIHGYDLIDHAQVWKVVREQVPLLLRKVESILQEILEKPTEDQE
jgi:uncharacterized protein with HEPN domain